MLKMAVLGAGFMGGTHARALATLSDVTIVGISSRSADKAQSLASEVGAKAFTDVRALLDHPEVEAVSITLPTHLHKEYAVAALDAGKHVFLEKPMGLSVEECDAIIEASRRNQRLLMVGHVLRFWPEYVALVDFVKSGDLGKPLSATATRLCEAPDWSSWFANPEWTGGGVLDLHIHDLDVLNWLFGRPRSLAALGRRGVHGGWDQAMTLLDYGDVKCFAEGNATMPAGYPFTMALAVRCENGSVEYTLRAGGEQVDSIEAGAAGLTVYPAGEDPRPLESRAGDGYANELAYFVQCVREGRDPEHGSGEQGRLAVETALAARRSIETGAVVTF